MACHEEHRMVVGDKITRWMTQTAWPDGQCYLDQEELVVVMFGEMAKTWDKVIADG